MDENSENYTVNPTYMEALKTIVVTQIFVLEVDGDHLFEFDQQLYRQLENYPTDIIPMFDLVATGIYKENLGQWTQNEQEDNGDNTIV